MSIVRVTPKEESRESGDGVGDNGRDFPAAADLWMTSHSIEQAVSLAVTDESIYHACAKLARHKIGGIANRQARPPHFRLEGFEFILCSSHGMEDSELMSRFMKVKIA